MTHQLQSTISGSVSLQGTGVHTGGSHMVTLMGAPANHGIQFEITQAGATVRIPAHVNHVCCGSLCTSLCAGDAVVHTVEHLLATMYALGITNLLIKVDGTEIPMGDGSAHTWTKLLKPLVQSQHKPAPCIQITQPIRVGDSHVWCELSPSSKYELEYDLHFEHPLLRDQHVYVDVNPQSFVENLSWARTFGFYEQLQGLQQQNKSWGASLDNVLVFDTQGVMNPGGMRSMDEACRHKIVDVLGDLSLMGVRIQGRFRGHHSGHALNHELARTVLNSPQCWRWV